MDTSYGNIEHLYDKLCYTMPKPEADYYGTDAEDNVIKTLYRLRNLIESLFTMYPPISTDNRLAIVRKVRDALMNEARQLDASVPLDAGELERLMDCADEPDREAIWESVKEYLHPIIKSARNAGLEQLQATA